MSSEDLNIISVLDGDEIVIEGLGPQEITVELQSVGPRGPKGDTGDLTPELVAAKDLAVASAASAEEDAAATADDRAAVAADKVVVTNERIAGQAAAADAEAKRAAAAIILTETENVRNEVVTLHGETETARDDAQGFATAADEDAAATAADRIAVGNDKDAVAADKLAAIAAKDASETARDTTLTARDEAVAARDSLVVDMQAVEDERVLAEAARAGSEAARDASIVAKDASEAARDVSVTAKNDSETARDVSVAAKNDSEAARDLSIGARAVSEAARDDAEAALDEFYSAYLGKQASDPTLDRNGDALDGDEFYINSATGRLRYYNGTVWADSAASSSIVVHEFVGDDTPGPFALPVTPPTKNACWVLLNGAPQERNAYEVGPSGITFDDDVLSTDTVEVTIVEALSIGIPADDVIDADMIKTGEEGAIRTRLDVPSNSAVTSALNGKLAVDGSNLGGNSAALRAALGDEWAFQPIGVPIPVLDSVVGVAAPPTDRHFRYILLTAGEDGVGEYNEGVLTSENVTGSAPLVVATAVIDLAESPLNGQTINLINTERRFLRAGSAGTVQTDAMQGHFHARQYANTMDFNTSAGSFSSGPAYGTVASRDNVGAPSADGVNGTPRTANETRSKNIGVTYYLRIL